MAWCQSRYLSMPSCKDLKLCLCSSPILSLCTILDRLGYTMWNSITDNWTVKRTLDICNPCYHFLRNTDWKKLDVYTSVQSLPNLRKSLNPRHLHIQGWLHLKVWKVAWGHKHGLHPLWQIDFWQNLRFLGLAQRTILTLTSLSCFAQ